MEKQQVENMRKDMDRLVRAVECLIDYTDGFYRGPSVEVTKQVELAVRRCQRYLLK